MAAAFAQHMASEGAHFVSAAEAGLLRRLMFRPGGAINPATVGQSPQALARQAGFTVPDGARILVARLAKVGPEEPLSREKLTTVLGWYEVEDWRAGCAVCMELIHFGGEGHSLALHAQDEQVILAFGLEKPVHRIVVNTMSSLGGTGLTTGMAPSMTLGPGGVGGAITGDNIGVRHLFTVKTIARHLRDAPAAAMGPAGAAALGGIGEAAPGAAEGDLVEQIVQRVLADLRA